MMVASSSASRARRCPCSGAVLCDDVAPTAGTSSRGRERHARCAAARSGTPGSMPSQPSSLPTKMQLASLCSRIVRIVSAASVGIERDRDVARHPDREVGHEPLAQFFEKIAMLRPGGKPKRLQVRAMRRASSTTSPYRRSRVRAASHRLGHPHLVGAFNFELEDMVELGVHGRDVAATQGPSESPVSAQVLPIWCSTPLYPEGHGS